MPAHTPSGAKRASPELRASVFHFTVYLTAAGASAYAALWFAGRGISTAEIGIISAAPIVVMLLLNLFVGRLADRASDWKQTIVILSAAAAVASFGLFFINGFWAALLIWTLLTVPGGSIPPIIDAATLRLTRRNGTDFGVVRAWGTVGFMVASVVGGLVVGLFGEPAFVPLLILLSIARWLTALQLPQFRAPPVTPTPGAAMAERPKLSAALKPWFVLPIFAFALLQATHSIIFAFGPLLWNEQGVPEILFGPLIAASGGAEALMMFAWRRFGGRVSARYLILFAAAVAVVRWLIMALNPPVPVIFLMQCLHAFTFAIGYFGTVHFIANWTSEENAAEAQSFSFVLQQATNAVGLAGFGWLAGSFGGTAFLACAALAGASMACLVVSLLLKPVRSEVLPQQTAA